MFSRARAIVDPSIIEAQQRREALTRPQTGAKTAAPLLRVEEAVDYLKTAASLTAVHRDEVELRRHGEQVDGVVHAGLAPLRVQARALGADAVVAVEEHARPHQRAQLACTPPAQPQSGLD